MFLHRKFNHAAFAHAVVLHAAGIAPDNDVIQNVDVEDLSRVDESARYPNVFPARRRVAAGVIVGEDEFDGANLDCPLDDFAWKHRCRGD